MPTRRRRRASAGQVLIAVLAVSPLLAQDAHQHGDSGKLGTVTFANSCSADVQPVFAHGMALLHSFEFGPAIDAFQSVAGKDPACAIAYWGMGVAQWGNPFAPGLKPAPAIQPGRDFIEKATAIGAKTDRERDYVAAAGALYDRFETVDQRARMLAYRDAMAKLAAKYAADPEASTFYALSLAASADPSDKTYADLLKAGAILEKLWKGQPDHPGIPHYIIHSYDAPPLASRAVAAARQYAKIAPAAPHALHMPSHTFTRLGYWQDSIDTNILSAGAARKVNAIGEELHASDYQAYAYLQSGQDAAARRLVESLAEIVSRRGPGTTSAAQPPAGTYARAAIAARYALERGAWAEAARLETRTTPFPFADALTWFARAIGAARTRDVAGARAAVAELQGAIDRLVQQNETYWVEQVTIQKLGASAWLALAEGRTADALATMSDAADREDRTEKSAISPGPLAPARELLGDMLLELKQPKAALAEYQKTIAKEPNRFRALAGAATAAAQAGDAASAKKYNAQLVTICPKADTPGRPELQAARRSGL
jgi:hypothetical protein